MPGTKPKLTPLAARKQLLLLESELNREQLVEAIVDWKSEFNHSKEQLATIGSVASMATKVVATFTSVRRLFSGHGKGPKSWISLLFDGLTTGTSLWSLLSQDEHKKEK